MYDTIFNIVILCLVIYLVYIIVSGKKNNKNLYNNSHVHDTHNIIEYDEPSDYTYTGFNDDYIENNEYIGDALARYENENHYPIELDEGDPDGLYNESLYNIDGSHINNEFATY